MWSLGRLLDSQVSEPEISPCIRLVIKTVFEIGLSQAVFSSRTVSLGFEPVSQDYAEENLA